LKEQEPKLKRGNRKRKEVRKTDAIFFFFFFF